MGQFALPVYCAAVVSDTLAGITALADLTRFQCSLFSECELLFLAAALLS